MRKEIITLACAIGLFGSASAAFAGAYGEPAQAEETPAAAPAAVVAEPEVDYAAPGAYIGAGGLYAVELFDDMENYNVSNSSGFQVNAGYRVMPNLAVEARYERYTEFDLDPNGHMNGWSLTANAKAFVLTGRFQPYALVGLGYLSMDKDRMTAGSNYESDDGAFAMRFGGGMDAYITENISMGPEIAYVLPISSDDIDDLDFLTVGAGLRYTFR